jgi:hypothetical protein
LKLIKKRRCKFFATNLATTPSPWDPMDRIIEENWTMDNVQTLSNSGDLFVLRSYNNFQEVWNVTSYSQGKA